jgi:hypothetical protein
MKNLAVILLVFLSLHVFAKTKKEKHHEITEQDMIAQLTSCLVNKNSLEYTRLFPESDSIAYWTTLVAPSNSQPFIKAVYQLNNPAIGMQKDSILDAKLTYNFDSIMHRGEMLGVHWHSLLLARYELVKSRKTRDSILERIAPVRFTGYLFVRDMLTRKTYGVAVTDIMNIEGNWYGGQMQSIYQAATIDEYYKKMKIEVARIKAGMNGNFGEDSTFVMADTSEENSKIRKQVVDRKMFTGTFDNDIKVELYIRFYRGTCPEGICSWDATFKFGNKEEVVAKVNKTADGKWHFTEESGVMDLTQNADGFTGTWTSASDQTEYEVNITISAISNKKMRKLDQMLDDTYTEY